MVERARGERENREGFGSGLVKRVVGGGTLEGRLAEVESKRGAEEGLGRVLEGEEEGVVVFVVVGGVVGVAVLDLTVLVVFEEGTGFDANDMMLETIKWKCKKKK